MVLKSERIKASHPPVILKNIDIITSIGKKSTAATIFGKTKKFNEFTPIISRASICSVTRIVPISEAMFDPTLPAKINEIIVGENSKIVLDCVIYPTVYRGNKGFDMFDAVCKAITPPMKVDIRTTIGMELTPILEISLKSRLKKIDHFFGRVSITVNINMYLPKFCMTIFIAKLHIIFSPMSL